MISQTSLDKLNQFFSSFGTTTYKKGDILLCPGETSTSVFYINKGFVKAYRISEEGEELTLVILKQTDFFPMTCGINNTPNSHYFESLTPLEVFKAPQDLFLRFIKMSPEIFFELADHILNRFGGLLTRMEYLVVSRAYTKVAATLLVCAKSFGERSGETIVVRVPLTHKDIATLAGITRETTCLEMKKLEQKGLIGRLGRLFVVKDIKGLEEESLFDNPQDSLLNSSI